MEDTTKSALIRTAPMFIILLLVLGIVGFVGYFIYKFVFGGMEGSPCTTDNGTIWPFSGCNISAGLCCDGKCSKGPCSPTKQGGKCKLDSDCKGWTIFGDVACCDYKCVTKDWSGQVCNPKRKGTKCSAPDGTIWPFSKCDISAGMCCKGKCEPASDSKCKDIGAKGSKCKAPSGTAWPWSGCDITAGACCHGKCKPIKWGSHLGVC